MTTYSRTTDKTKLETIARRSSIQHPYTSATAQQLVPSALNPDRGIATARSVMEMTLTNVLEQAIMAGELNPHRVLLFALLRYSIQEHTHEQIHGSDDSDESGGESGGESDGGSGGGGSANDSTTHAAVAVVDSDRDDSEEDE